MKIRSIVLVGLLALLVFAIALFPASLAWKSVSSMASGLPVKVERVGGTIWNGFFVGKLNNPVLRGPVVVSWDLKGLRLLMGEANVGLSLEGQAYRLSGSGHWGLWGKGVADLNGDVQAHMLNQSLRQFDVSAQGVLKIEDLSINLSGKKITKANGQISWSGGSVTAAGRGASDPIMYPAVTGLVSEVDGNLLLAVTETQSKAPLGELGLLPEKNLGSVKVLQRVLTLAGMDSGGDDDKVLINMQQPLPF